MICFPKGPLVLPHALVMWTLYFSHFFKKFLTGLRNAEFVFLRAKVCILVFIICPLLVGIDCVTDKTKATFSFKKKHTLLSSNLVPRMPKIAFLGLWNFKLFWGRTRLDLPLPPPLQKGTNGPLLIQWVTLSKLLAILF